jgi:cell division protein ZapA (FtsZ GTPase activity inhibitor)
MKDEIYIRVNIFDRFYPIKVKSKDEESFKEISKSINKKIIDLMKRFDIEDKQDVLAMVCLEIFFEQNKNLKKISFISSQIDEISENIEKNL